MKKLFKAISATVAALVMLTSLFVFSASAKSATMYFSNGGNAKVGDIFTVTGTFKADETMYAISGNLNFDSSMFEFVSGSEFRKVSDGVYEIIGTAGSNTKTISCQLKAIKAGSANIAFLGIQYIDSQTQRVNFTDQGGVMKVTDTSSNLSSNANLKSLVVSSGTLTPSFSKNVTSYTVTINNNVTEFGVTPQVEDSKAKYTISGSTAMKVGVNKRSVTVTAENGATKTYTITIYRLDENGNKVDGTTPPATTGSIEVTADNVTMYIEQNFATDSIPGGFTMNVYNYNGTEVPCIVAQDVTALYLKSADGTAGGFYVLSKEGAFSKLNIITIGGSNYFLMPAPQDSIPAGYKLIDISIADQNVPAYQSEDTTLSDFVLIYAMGQGQYTGFYRYDTVESTMQRALGIEFPTVEETVVLEDTEPEGFIENIKNLNTNGKIVAITIVAILLMLVAVLVILIIKIVAVGKKRKLEEEEEMSESEFFGFDDITEQDNEEEQ